MIRSGVRLTLGGARNLGLERVRTPLVLSADADDVMPAGTLRRMTGALDRDPGLGGVPGHGRLWLPGHLAELDRVRRRHPEAMLIGTRTIETDRTGRHAVPRGPAPGIELISYFEIPAARTRPFHSSSFAVRRDAAREAGDFGLHPLGADRVTIRKRISRAIETPKAPHCRAFDG